MSGVGLLSRLAVRPGLRSAAGLRATSASLAAKVTPSAHLKPIVGSTVSKEKLQGGHSAKPRLFSTSPRSGQEAAVAAGGKNLKIAVIGQSMFGRDVS